MKKTLLLILLIITYSSHFSQTDSTKNSVHVMSSDWREQGITFGVNYHHHLYGEIGYFRSYVYEIGGFPMFSSTMNYGTEFAYNNELILAPKIQGRFHITFFNTSLAALFYSNLNKKYAFKIRPEIGVGLWKFDLNYGYNIGIITNNLSSINKHIFSFRYYFNLKKKYLNEFDQEGNIVE